MPKSALPFRLPAFCADFSSADFGSGDFGSGDFGSGDFGSDFGTGSGDFGSGDFATDFGDGSGDLSSESASALPCSAFTLMQLLARLARVAHPNLRTSV